MSEHESEADDLDGCDADFGEEGGTSYEEIADLLEPVPDEQIEKPSDG